MTGWTLTITRASDGRELHRTEGLSQKELISVVGHALRGNLAYPELPRQTELKLKWETKP